MMLTLKPQHGTGVDARKYCFNPNSSTPKLGRVAVLVLMWCGSDEPPSDSWVNCVPNTFQPSRDPSAGWWCHSAAGAILY